MKLGIPALLLATLSLLLSCNQPTESPAAPPKAKNIILLIGDGMGLAQLSSAYYFSDTTPNFSRFKYIGLHQTTPVGNLITDSAAGATAFSTGQKSYNSAIGVDKDTMPLETILEWAAKQGKHTGLVATSSITHATPASFYAHVKNRYLQEEIAAYFVNAPVDFAAGGGIQYFNKRADGKNLLDSLVAKGVDVDTTELGAMPLSDQRHAYLLAPDSLRSIWGGRGDFLPKATSLALDFLSQHKDGFFLMVEGSQIDWGGHNKNAQFIINEVIDFDQTVGLALDFAARDGNTLVIVTADHETGGFALSAPSVFGVDDYSHIVPTFSTSGHTASLIPVLAYGPGADQFMGVYQNNAIYDKMVACFQ